MGMQSPESNGNRPVNIEGQLPDAGGQVTALDGLTAYINAGGRGVRLSSIFHPHERRGVSKALLPIGQPPISLIEHQINKLDHAGVPTIVAGVGNHENVAEYMQSLYVGRNNIHAVHYENQLGNGGDLVRTVRDYPELFAENVLITCVDVLLDVDEADFFAFHQDTGGDLLIALTLNMGVPNEGAYYVDSEGRVIYCGEVNQNCISEDEAAVSHSYRGSSTGALIANKDTLRELEWQPEDGPLSLYGEVVATALGRGSMFAFNNGGRLFTDVGTVDSWSSVQANSDMITPYIHYANLQERKVAS